MSFKSGNLGLELIVITGIYHGCNFSVAIARNIAENGIEVEVVVIAVEVVGKSHRHSILVIFILTLAHKCQFNSDFKFIPQFIIVFEVVRYSCQSTLFEEYALISFLIYTNFAS